jgi:FKBP-type peptidyl-prolyl cis-trans isomerase
MITTPSGLQYEDTTRQRRRGPPAARQVHYTGWLHDPTAADGARPQVRLQQGPRQTRSPSRWAPAR